MNIDITSQPQTVAQIEEQRREAEATLTNLDNRKRQIKHYFYSISAITIILMLSLYLMGNISKNFFLLMAAVSGAFWVAVKVEDILALLVGALVGMYFGDVMMVITVVFGAWLLLSIYDLISQHIEQPKDTALVSLHSLSDADKSSCVDIDTWLTDPTIANYRNAVIEQGRVFTQGEVNAMKAWIENAESQKTAAKNEEKIQSTNRMVDGANR